MAFISHRYSIRWLPESASEPTSTLVLTLESGFYIDIRIIHNKAKDPPPCLPKSEDELLMPTGRRQQAARPRHDGNLYQDSEPDPMPTDELDWAFAGQSRSIPASNDKPRQCTWEHWVDSGACLIGGKPIEDSGVMYPPEDGKCLEKGSMANPATGKETEYEEVWEDLELTHHEGLEYDSYVFTHDYEGNCGRQASRGVAMQLGCWFQSVIRKEELDEDGEGDRQFGAARWRWDEEGHKWDMIAKVGKCEALAPDTVEAVMSSPDVRVGHNVQIKSQSWKCKELGDRRSAATADATSTDSSYPAKEG
jgi:hypothetical protein